MPSSRNDAERSLTISRVIDAPRDLVWRAFTEPEHLVHWWGPDGFTNTFHEIDMRPGGVWRFMMHGPDGTDYPNRIIFLEIVKPERLVYDHDGDGARGPTIGSARPSRLRRRTLRRAQGKLRR